MVVLNYTLQLLPAADWPPLLRRVQSALRPGGLLFLTAKVGPYIGDDPEDSAAAAAIDDGLCAPSHFATVPLQRVHLNSALGVPTARWSQHCVLKYTVCTKVHSVRAAAPLDPAVKYLKNVQIHEIREKKEV